MRLRTPSWGTVVVCAVVCATCLTTAAHPVAAATISVPAGGDLQAALNAAQGGDVILLEPGATYVGNFTLPNKPGITEPIVVRSAASDSLLPAAGVRITPTHAHLLPKIRSANAISALRTAAGAHHWTLRFLEFQANYQGYGEIISLGAGDSSQSTLDRVPHTLVLDRLYIHGDATMGQKRGIALHSRDTQILNSYVADCKLVGQDSQAISGFNGPGNYLIENNYLEGAGENFMLGGADPVIPNLVTANVVFRHNHLRKPLEWRDPIVGPVSGLAAVASPGAGALLPGTYYYKVAARRVTANGGRATSATPVEVSATLSAAGAVTLTWSPVPGADDYVIYGRTSATQNTYWKTTVPVFTDTGAAGTAGAPVKASKWTAKNLFELKNAEDVLVEGNVMENNWVGDQPGYAVVLTPRNQDGRAPWTVVQRVVFRYNLVRHTAGGVNILGRDNLAPSLLTNTITIEHNVFDDLTAATWGSGSRFVQIGDGPDLVTISHNTVITTNSAVMLLYGGTASAPIAITNFRYTDNMSRHNSYGIMATGSSPGLPSIAMYLPGGVVQGNVLAGGSALKYPPGNFFPTVAGWEAEFVGYAAGDYRLGPGSQFKGAGTDGKDLGADVEAVNAHAANALSGNNALPVGANQVQILTTALPNGVMNQAYAQSLACTGGVAECMWALRADSLPAGLAFDAVAGIVSGVPTTPGSGSLSVEAYDSSWPSNSATRTLSVSIDAPLFSVDVPLTATGQVGVEFALTPRASGAVGQVTWSVSGFLPAGLSLDASSGLISGLPASWGTFSVVLTARDAWGSDRTAESSVTFTIVPTLLTAADGALAAAVYGQAYFAQLAASGGTGAVAWSLLSGSLPAGLTLSSSGSVAGTPVQTGSFTLAAQVVDGVWPGYADSATFTLSVAAPALTASLPASAAGQVGQAFSITPSLSGALGSVSWTIASGSAPPGTSLNAASGAIAGTPTGSGTFNLVLRATDIAPGLTRTASAAVLITIAPAPVVVINEVVMHAARAVRTGGVWQRVADATAASGYRMWSPDRSAPKLSKPLASPASYLEMTFDATAGVPYHVWVRGKADRNYWGNDSVFLQFSGSMVSNAPAYRIGTTSGMAVSIEESINAGLSGWGWQDGTLGGLDVPIRFAASGPQTIRVQVREDGVSIDQIVISAVRYLSAAPGSAKNDATILADTAVAGSSAMALRTAPVASDVVLYAEDATLVAGNWQPAADPTAANGVRMWNPDAGAAKLLTPLAAPSNYFELSFDAESGLPYHVWVRGKADGNHWANDSAYLQFTNTVDAAGRAANRIGTPSALMVTIEDSTGAGLAGWGWQDTAFAALAEPIVFAVGGRQTMRVQTREDGLSIDQIVLSSARYLTARPGALKNDDTILPQ